MNIDYVKPEVKIGGYMGGRFIPKYVIGVGKLQIQNIFDNNFKLYPGKR